MESGAKGCEVVVSGKLRGQRAKSMKFVDGLMVHSGNPVREYIDSAVTHVHLRQGTFPNSLCSACVLAILTPFSVSPKGGTRVLPPSFLTWFPLMWSLECLTCFDLMENYIFPPPFLFLLGGNTAIESRDLFVHAYVLVLVSNVLIS